MTEIWKDIQGYEGKYQISNLGKVKSLARLVKNRGNGFKPIGEVILRSRIDEDGYYRVALCRDCKYKVVGIHRLVAQYFIKNPYNKPLVCHKNGDCRDNRIENLYWGTVKDNSCDALRHGKINVGDKCNLSTLNEKQVRVIKHIQKRSPKFNQAWLGRMFGVNKETINAIFTSRNWKQVTI